MSFDSTASNIQDWLLEHKPLVAGLAFVGFASIASQLLTFLSVLSQTFILSGTKLTKYGAKRGAYAGKSHVNNWPYTDMFIAVVTGATDGIGREFALQLAKAGFGVVLVSRTQEKLNSLAEEISSKFKVPTKVQAIDFGRTDQGPAYSALAKQLEGVEVGVLVNNVGRSHEMPVYFAETTDEEMNSIINININGTLAITRVILPKMIEKKNGLILNIGSFAGTVASPMLATYSGSKAFLSAWSQALAEEYKSKGISVQLATAFFVVSNMSKVKRPSMSTPTAKAWVASCLSHIGLSCGAIARPYSLTPYWSHAIADYAIGAINAPTFVISQIHRIHTDIRRRALRKKDRLAKQQ